MNQGRPAGTGGPVPPKPRSGEGGISDAAIERLRRLDDRPDFSGSRYDLGDEIGRGGMGIVFRGRDRELDRDVAIKVTAWSTAGDADRLRREARTLAALEHPGIVPVHDVGRLQDGRVYSVMALVRGERLDACARRLALPDRLRLFDRICDTVSFAHARGVVHGDLKPANVMVGEFGQVLVLDWGGGGTEGYMAPEQAAGAADARSDVYALGAILRDLTAADAERARALKPLTSIVRRAMGAEPAARYATPGELAADVRRFLDGGAVAAHPEGPLERTRRLARVYRTALVLVLTYLAVRILLLLWSR
jgi:eukaryotic-like serine/threonine-protein kinase